MAPLTYLYEHPRWSRFTWNARAILEPLAEAAAKEGHILGRMERFSPAVRRKAALISFSGELVKSAAIEGDRLDGLAAMMLDGVNAFDAELTLDRLRAWHGALLPPPGAGIKAAGMREDRPGLLKVMGRLREEGRRGEKLYEAPRAELIPGMTEDFLRWFNRPAGDHPGEHPLIRAGICHLWFAAIQPFETGNGRIGRLLTGIMLARAGRRTPLFYGMSVQLHREKDAYAAALDAALRGSPDITRWLRWFLRCLGRSIDEGERLMSRVLKKTEFWQKNALAVTDRRQRKIINMLIEGAKSGFPEGSIRSSQFAEIAECSQDTAIRLLKDLVAKNILSSHGAGPNIHYALHSREARAEGL
jgi:Fic family protein